MLADQFGTQYFRLFNAKTLLVSQLPGTACAGRLSAYAVATPMLSPAIALASYAAHAGTLVLAAFGLALWRRWRQPLALFAAAFLLYQLALYAGLHVMQRYLFQMMPLLCGFAGSALALLIHRDDAHRNVLCVTKPRLAAGAALAATLLALAFLGPMLDGNCR